MSTTVLFSKHAANEIRKLKSVKPAIAQRMLADLRNLALQKDLKRSRHQVIHGQPSLLSLSSGDYRVLYTVDTGADGETIYVVGLVSRNEPEGSVADIKEVMVSTATG